MHVVAAYAQHSFCVFYWAFVHHTINCLIGMAPKQSKNKENRGTQFKDNVGPAKKPRINMPDINIYLSVLVVGLMPAGTDDPWRDQLQEAKFPKEVIVMVEFYVGIYGLVRDQIFLELFAGSGRFLHPSHIPDLESQDGHGSAM